MDLLFYKYLINFLLSIFHIYITMYKNLSATYYQENKERLQRKSYEKAPELFLSKQEKEKKQQYGRESYKNFSEHEKILFEYRRKYYQMRKNAFHYNYKKVPFPEI